MKYSWILCSWNMHERSWTHLFINIHELFMNTYFMNYSSALNGTWIFMNFFLEKNSWMYVHEQFMNTTIHEYCVHEFVRTKFMNVPFNADEQFMNLFMNLIHELFMNSSWYFRRGRTQQVFFTILDMHRAELIRLLVELLW
jgi:hypothetical protein